MILLTRDKKASRSIRIQEKVSNIHIMEESLNYEYDRLNRTLTLSEYEEIKVFGEGRCIFNYNNGRIYRP